MNYFTEHLSNMSIERKLARIKSYLNFLQLPGIDQTFLDLLLMSRELHQSSMCRGDTSIIDVADSINEFVRKTLDEACEHIDRPYHAKFYENKSTYMQTHQTLHSKNPTDFDLSPHTALRQW